MNNLIDALSEEMISLHRQFIIANHARLQTKYMSTLFFKYLGANSLRKAKIRFLSRHFGTLLEKSIFKSNNNDIIINHLFMSAMNELYIFYAFIYTVLEGCLNAKITNGQINKLIADDDKVKKLKRLRNAIFHVQKEMQSEKIFGFLEAPETEDWVDQLHLAIEQALINHTIMKPFFDYTTLKYK